MLFWAFVKLFEGCLLLLNHYLNYNNKNINHGVFMYYLFSGPGIQRMVLVDLPGIISVSSDLLL